MARPHIGLFLLVGLIFIVSKVCGKVLPTFDQLPIPLFKGLPGLQHYLPRSKINELNRIQDDKLHDQLMASALAYAILRLNSIDEEKTGRYDVITRRNRQPRWLPKELGRQQGFFGQLMQRITQSIINCNTNILAPLIRQCREPSNPTPIVFPATPIPETPQKPAAVQLNLLQAVPLAGAETPLLQLAPAAEVGQLLGQLTPSQQVEGSLTDNEQLPEDNQQLPEDNVELPDMGSEILVEQLIEQLLPVIESSTTTEQPQQSINGEISSLSCFFFGPSNNCQANCIIYASGWGYLQSSNYPDIYDKNLNCKFRIVAEPGNRKIQITFQDLLLSSNDLLYVNDEYIPADFDQPYLPSPITSNNDTMVITLDTHQQEQVNLKWKIKIQVV